jgi:enamine deaminase RidA (YjgF/YER057c/UK114 family)
MSLAKCCTSMPALTTAVGRSLEAQMTRQGLGNDSRQDALDNSSWNSARYFEHCRRGTEKTFVSTPANNHPSTAEQKLHELGLELPPPPEPFGLYAEAVQTGNQLFLTGMLSTEGRIAKFLGRLGAELNVKEARQAAHLAALNALAVVRQQLGSLDKVARIVRLGVYIATSGDVRDHPIVADGASELLQDVFGKEKNPSRLVYGVASLPLGTPVELEIIFEVAS